MDPYADYECSACETTGSSHTDVANFSHIIQPYFRDNLHHPQQPKREVQDEGVRVQQDGVQVQQDGAQVQQDRV